ncbi:MAG: polymer-forming cytoskeletal protein [Verrucomicrobiota bacterium]|nr:polymer-forming cytoskeletal protein [Verrucomicrobiota bacterium]
MQMFSPTRRNEPVTPPAPEQPSNGISQPAPQAPVAPVRASRGGVLSAGVSIEGSLTFGEELTIDCQIEGTITSDGRLTIEKNAHVTGEVRAGSVTLFGTVDGNVTAGERCELRAGCTLRGDIEAPRLVVDDDATFVGSAKITKRAKPAASAES